MEKLAVTQHPVHELIRRRWSPRAFADKPVELTLLHSLLEAARWAPSSNNEQPWSYIIATRDNPAEYERMMACLREGNQGWAKNAPVLMLSVARMTFERNGQPNRVALYDLGAAAAYLTFEATARGLTVHQMAGILPEKARELYSVPGAHEVVTGIAIGYPGDPETLPEDLQKKELSPRSRKLLAAFVFSGKWGEPSPLVEP
jgi:nitroreductase